MTPTSDTPGATPTQLTKALSDLQVSKKHAHIAQHKFQELVARLEQNDKVIVALQEEVE